MRLRVPVRTGRFIAPALVWLGAACTGVSADTEFFGRVEPPERQILRYISGSEPQSLDPQIGTGQPEARIYMALFEGLVDYHPKTMQPVPGVAETWEVNEDSTEFVFHLQPEARWSNGDPLTAADFVYSFRRGLSPELAAQNAYLAYYIKYAQAYNEGRVFVRDPETGVFLGEDPESALAPASSFREYILGPTRLTLPGDATARRSVLEGDPQLAARVEGAEFVPVRPEDIGVEAVDDRTLRVSLNLPAPFMSGLFAHQFFFPVHRATVEAHGERWTRLENMVSNGAFRLAVWAPYNKLVVRKNPFYWDAGAVRLEEITFYPLEEATTMMNLYKAGEVDAVFNHVVPIAWLDVIQTKLDYMDAPENAIEYYMFNMTQPPMDDVRVRKAFNAAIDKNALGEYRRVAKPLTAFTPEGIYPGYPQPGGDPFDPERARRLLAEAGYAGADGEYDPRTFPLENVELTYNTTDSNRQVAEFVQAQWRQHLGLTIPLRNMEWQTYLAVRSALDYDGIARAGWVGDYMDPFSFLSIFYVEGGNNGTGWWDPEFIALLDAANMTPDPEERYRVLAEAEAHLLEAQPVIPLLTQATNWMKKPYVKGMYPNPGTLHPWKHVYIEHDPALWDRGVPDMTE